MSNIRNDCVALLILGVKGHMHEADGITLDQDHMSHELEQGGCGLGITNMDCLQGLSGMNCLLIN